MSYDVWLEADLGGPEPVTIDSNINHTSNTSQMWRDAGADIAEMHGKTASECLPDLQAAIADISANPGKYERHEAANGWGTVDTTLAFLRRIEALFLRAPKAKVVVSR